MSFAVDKNFLDLNEQETLDLLKVDKNGLTDKEAISRILKYGSNSLKNYAAKIQFQKSRYSAIRLKTLYYLVLIFLSLLVSNYILLVFLLIIFLIEIVGLFKINHKIEDDVLKLLRLKSAKVRRNNKSVKLSPSDITIGDIIYFQKGDVIPADIRIVEVKKDILIEDLLYSNFPNFVFKTLKKTTKKLYLDNFIFTGEKIIDGEGLGVVVQVGMLTRLGKVLSLEQVIDRRLSDFSIVKSKLSQILMLIFIFISLLFLILNLKFFKFQNYNLYNFLISIMLAGLPIGFFVNFINYSNRKKSIVSNETKHSVAETDLIISTYENLFIDTKTNKLTKLHSISGNYDAENVSTINKNLSKLNLLMEGLFFTNQPSVLLSDSVQEKNIKLNNEREYQTIQNFLSSIDLNKDIAKDSKEIKYLNIENEVTISVISKNDKIFCYVKAPSEYLLSKSANVLGKDNKIRPLNLVDIKYFSNFQKKSLAKSIGIAYKSFDSKTAHIKTSEILSNLTFIGQVEIDTVIKETNLDAVSKAKKQNLKLVVFCSNSFESDILTDHLGSNISIGSVKDFKLISDKNYDYYLDKGYDVLTIIGDNPEARFEIIKNFNESDLIITYIGDNINDLAGLKIVSNGIVSEQSNLAGLKADYLIRLPVIDLSFLINTIVESKKNLINIVKIFYSIFLGSISAILLVVFSIIGFRYLNIPPVVTPITIILFLTIGIVLPTRTLLLDKHFSQELKSLKNGLINRDSISKIFFIGLIISILTFFNYLIYFIRVGVSPYYISTANPIYSRAIFASLITLILLNYIDIIFEKASYYQNDLLERLISNKETFWYMAACLVGVFGLSYFNPLKPYINSINLTDIIYCVFFVGFFIAIKTLLVYGKKNSKKELIRLYREIFG